MLIDAHTHISAPQIIADRARLVERDDHFRALYADPRARLATADSLIMSLTAAGVDAAVTFGFAFRSLDLCRLCNDYTLACAKAYCGRLVPLAVTNPTTADGLREASRCLAAGARGLGELMPAGQGYGLDDRGLDALLDLAREAAVPVLVHVNEPLGHHYPGKGPHGPVEALRLIERHPDNDIILAHWGGGLCFYELMPEVRAVCRRVYYDTAASTYLYDDAIYANALGWAPGRVLWGTDYPLIAPHRALTRVRALALMPSAEADLLAATSRPLFGLKETV